MGYAYVITTVTLPMLFERCSEASIVYYDIAYTSYNAICNPRDGISYGPVSVSLSDSQVGILSKRVNESSRFLT